jgi:hypothetical protein
MSSEWSINGLLFVAWGQDGDLARDRIVGTGKNFFLRRRTKSPKGTLGT